MAFIFVILKPRVSKVSFLPSRQGKSPAVSSAELGIKPLPRISAPYLHSPVEHRARLTCAPAVVHCVWPHKTMAVGHAASRAT